MPRFDVTPDGKTIVFDRQRVNANMVLIECLTLPAAIREKYGLADGDPLTLVDLEGAILLTPKVLTVPRLAEQLERLRRKKGLRLKDLSGPRRED